MAKLPKSLQNLIESFERLPGIGPKTAERLAFYMLRVPQSNLDDFAISLTDLKKLTKICSICKNVGESDPCEICDDTKRDQSQIMVVEEPMDILSFEKSGKFNGAYHVLHGVINPLENIGPGELYINDLIKRVKLTNGHTIHEVIIGTNPTMEGEATAMFLTKEIKAANAKVKVTRLGMGIPTGADLGYADPSTLREAINGRREI